MTKEFIPYNLALELKELGFDEPCFTYYKNDQLSDILELVKNSEMENVNNEVDDYISAPTYSQAFRFFREKYGYLVSPFQNENNLFFFEIGKLNTLKTEHYSKDWETYEDAEISCLVKLIEIIKNK